MDENLFRAILWVVLFLMAIITSVIVPYIKEKIGNEKLARYKYWVSTAVECAEMIFNEQGMGKIKKEYVVNFINEMFNKNKTVITIEQIEILVESAVKVMKLNEIK